MPRNSQCIAPIYTVVYQQYRTRKSCSNSATPNKSTHLPNDYPKRENTKHTDPFEHVHRAKAKLSDLLLCGWFV